MNLRPYQTRPGQHTVLHLSKQWAATMQFQGKPA